MKNHYLNQNTIYSSILYFACLCSFFGSFASAIKDTHNPALLSTIAPIIEDQDFSVIEGSIAGTSLGIISASGTNLTYIITSADFLGANEMPNGDSPQDPAYDAAAVFSLNTSTGALSVNNPKYLLSVLGPVNLQVLVTDAQGAQATATIRIAITDTEIDIADRIDLNWSMLSNHPQGHSEATGGVLEEKMYVFSGFTANFAPKEDVFSFDIPANIWNRLEDMPPMANNSGAGGATHMGWTQDGTDIYIAAGYAADASGNAQQFASERVYRYNVNEDNYEELPSLPIARSAGALEFIDNKLYYVAGTNRNRDEDQSDLLVLDLDNLNEGWMFLSQMPNPRNHVGSTVFDGQLYIFGGQKEHDEELVPQDDVHRYDPATDTWTHVTDMPMPFNHIHASIFTFGDYIYSVGGQIEHNAGAYANVYAYNPINDVWLQFTDLPARRFSTVAGAFEGKIYVSGGNNSRATYVATLPEAFLSIAQDFNEVDASLDFMLYPNPAQNSVHLSQSSKQSIKSLTIYNSQGQVLKKYNPNALKQDNGYTIPIEELPSGSYLLQIIDTANKKHTRHVLIK